MTKQLLTAAGLALVIAACADGTQTPTPLAATADLRADWTPCTYTLTDPLAPAKLKNKCTSSGYTATWNSETAALAAYNAAHPAPVRSEGMTINVNCGRCHQGTAPVREGVGANSIGPVTAGSQTLWNNTLKPYFN